jgi:hypothetical protein
MVRVALITLALALAAPGLAHADSGYFAHSGDASTVKYRQDKKRSPKNRALIYGLLGGAALGLGVGIYFHLDSHDAASELSDVHTSSPLLWTDDRQATYDRAGSSGTIAIVGYSVSAVCAIGAILTAVLTHPGQEVKDVRPTTSITPTHGGAMVARAWSF